MFTYSVAIRTLGTAGEKFYEELRSLHRQTISPERILVYIAKGYQRPKKQIGREEYIWVEKGMLAQRALPYDEITSDCVLLLDDDVWLADDSVARMLHAMQEHDADCVGADTFQNQSLSFWAKSYAAVTNLVFPRPDDGWAFKIHRTGSFSYNNHPRLAYYPSQSCAGPCSLWRKKAFLHVRLQDELWMERAGFWYGEDVLLFYKLYVNGGKLGILYHSGVMNLDGQTASATHKQTIQRYYIRAKASAIIWHRTVYSVYPNSYTICVFVAKQLWLLLVNIVAAIVLFHPKIPILFMQGVRDAYRYCHSASYQSLPPYKFSEP